MLAVVPLRVEAADAVAEELPPAPRHYPVPIRWLGCRTDPPLTRSDAVVFGRGSELSPYYSEATLVDGRIQLQTYGGGDIGELEDAILAIPGWTPVTVRTSESVGRVARCAPADLPLAPPQAWVEGTVHEADPRMRPSVVAGCGGVATVDPDGGYRIAVTPGEPCTLWAGRPGGRVWGRGEPVSPVSGQTPRVPLSTTPDSIRRFRFDVRVVPEGLEVIGVARYGEGRPLPGPGDVIQSVDGRPLTGADPVGVLIEALSVPGKHPIEVSNDGSPYQTYLSWGYYDDRR